MYSITYNYFKLVDNDIASISKTITMSRLDAIKAFHCFSKFCKEHYENSATRFIELRLNNQSGFRLNRVSYGNVILLKSFL